MSSERTDPSWNLVPRTLLVYSLPFALLAVCLHEQWVGGSRDFWVPLLFALAVPGFCISRLGGRLWAFRDFQNRDHFPLPIALLHAVVWCLAVRLTPDPWTAAIVFAAAFFTFDVLLVRFGLLAVYFVPERIQRRGAWATVSYFGFFWWPGLACGFALVHRFGTDAAGSIALAAGSMTVVALAGISVLRLLRFRRHRFTDVRKVAVIGAGWSGLYAVKWLKEEGLDVTCFETGEAIGGVWSYCADRSGGVFRDTRATSSKHFLHASDHAFDPAVPDFPHHSQVLGFLDSYAERFGLRDHVRLAHRVAAVERREEGGWMLEIEHGGARERRPFDAVVVASGPQGRPRIEIEAHPLFGRFTGTVMHAADYKHSSSIGADEKVLVVGAGESAADIVAECVARGCRVEWASRHGQWFADRNIGPFAADLFVAPGFRALAGRLMHTEYLIRRLVIGFFINMIWGRGGHGIRRWIPPAPYLHQFVNKSRDGILEVYRGRVEPRSEPVRISGCRVWFAGAAEGVEFDRIILATGYRPHWPFLAQNPGRLYKKVFAVEDPTLAFVGLARPVLGSIPSMSEAQTRWTAAVFSGRVALPHTEMRRNIAYFDQRFHPRRYLDSSELGVLVDQEDYATALATEVGAEVRWLRLLLTHPRAFLAVIRSPWIAFKYQLRSRDPARRRAAVEAIERELPDIRHPMNWLLLDIPAFFAAGVTALALAIFLLPWDLVAAALAAVLAIQALVLRWSEHFWRRLESREVRALRGARERRPGEIEKEPAAGGRERTPPVIAAGQSLGPTA